MRKLLLLIYSVLFLAGSAFSQNILQNPAQGYSGSQLKYKLMFNKNDSIIFSWSKNITAAGYKLKIGTTRGNYNLTSFSVTKTRKSVKPSASGSGLSVGRYFAVVTNSAKNTLSGIQSDYVANPQTVFYSNEIEFIVEAQTAPLALSPRGSVTESTPLFEWNPVSGVPAYWLIVSSTPFSVVTLPSGEVSVQGANVLWNYITKETSVRYGDPNKSNVFNDDAPPLLPGNEYNYTILNLYDENDITYASSVFGGAVSFSYNSPATINPPVLVAPAENSSFYGTSSIQFKWDPVANANNYSLYIFERVSSFAGNEQEIDIPVTNFTTTNTSIYFNAKDILKNGKYVWYVIPNDANGAGNKSVTRSFNYILEMGAFNAQVYSTLDNKNLIGFELKANAIVNGSTPANSFYATNAINCKDSLVVGTYEITGKKAGYADSTFIYEIRKGSTVNMGLKLRPLPARLSGKVVNQSGTGIAIASVKIENILTGSVKTLNTDAQGNFSASVPKASYYVSASKPGYKAGSKVSITVNKDQVILSSSIVLTLDKVSFFGKVLNDELKPVALASVKASKDGVTQEVKSDNNGNFTLQMTSGTWTLEASKLGFISSGTKSYTFSAGETVQNEVFKITPRANQVSGTVKRIYTISNNTTGTTAAENVKVTAYPISGSSVSATTNTKGEYTLNLKSGSYQVKAENQGYTPDKSINLDLTVAQTIANIDFRMSPNPSSIAGKIVSSAGSAIEGAKISSSTGESTTSLSDGTYKLSISQGEKIISAVKDGYISPEPLTINISAGQNLTGQNFTILPNAAKISGTVTNQQLPVGSVQISASNGTATRSVLTDASGNYTLNIEPGSWKLTAVKAGFVSQTGNTITVRPGQASAGNNFALIKNISQISGVVKSNDGPAADASLIFTATDNSGLSYSTKSGINGEYVVSVNAGKSYSASVTKTGYLKKTAVTSQLAADSKVSLNFTLSPTLCSISGAVSDNQGTLPDASVKISQSGTTVNQLVSEYNGSFSAGLAPGSYTITASKMGYLSKTVNISVISGQTLTGIALKLDKNSGSILGTVKNMLNEPVAAININFEGTNGKFTQISDGAGGFLISDVPSGSYKMILSKEGYQTKTEENISVSAGATEQISTSVTKYRSIISGKIKDENNNLIGGANITVSASGKNYSTVSADDGSYSIGPLPAGTYSISAVKSSYSSVTAVQVTVASNNETVSFDFQGLKKNTSQISGTIKSEGTAVADASINIVGNNGSAYVKSSQSGTYQSPLLESGNYTITVSKTGYSSSDTVISVSGSVTNNFTLIKNSGVISGTVKDQSGSLLSDIKVDLLSSAENISLSATSDASGNFKFTELKSGAAYNIFTDVFKEGYVNDTLSVTLSGNIATADLTVIINDARVTGNTDLGSVTVTLINSKTSATQIAVSSSTGNYKFEYLSEGTYTITPSKQGVTFTPKSKSITLLQSDSLSASFKAASTLGNFKVTVKDQDTKAVENADVNIYSGDESLVFTASTGSSGEALLEDIPAGGYYLKASKEGYESSTAKQITVQSGLTSSASLTIIKNTSGISGKIYTDGSKALSDASVLLVMKASGTGYNTVSGSDGNYSITNIPSGDAVIYVSKQGYVEDSLAVVLVKNSVLSNKNFTLSSSSVKLTGKVLYKGAGLAGVNISAQSTDKYTVTTNSTGAFVFSNLLLRGDTTVYVISLPDYGIDSKIMKFMAVDAGKTKDAGNFNVPSASIQITFSDRVNPVQGVKVSISNENNFSFSSVSDESGLVATGETLVQGNYNIALETGEYLRPNNYSDVVSLNDDQSVNTSKILLPYTFNAPDTFFADRANAFEIGFAKNPSNAAASLFYKSASEQEYNETPITKGQTAFKINMLPLYALEEVSCYVQVTDAEAGLVYRSNELIYKPVAVDEISQMRLTPDFASGFLRPDDNYEMSVSLRNGEGTEILAKSGLGTLTPTLSYENLTPEIISVSFADTSRKSTLKISTRKEGSAELRINAVYGSSSLSQTIKFVVKNIEISELKVQSQAGKISNRAEGVRFSVSGSDTSGQNIYLGSGLEWSINPEEAGSIDNTGLFIPVDETYIGQVEVTATDPLTGLSSSNSVNVYAEIDPDNDYTTLTDKRGMNFILRPSSVNNTVQIYLSKPYAGIAKKQHTDFKSGQTFTVAENIYNVQYYSGVALPGDTLLHAASIELPSDESLKFNNGSKYIAVYDQTEKLWKKYSKTNANTDGFTVNEVYRFGEYSLIAENEPLGFRHAAVLPSPFSPRTAPAKIGYFLTTTDRQASVTIKIYNIEGVLVRTLLEGDPQVSGRYGGRMGLKEIEWDGLTDAGTIARNGRYLIRLQAKDSSGEKSEILQVVLVK